MGFAKTITKLIPGVLITKKVYASDQAVFLAFSEIQRISAQKQYKN